MFLTTKAAFTIILWNTATKGVRRKSWWYDKLEGICKFEEKMMGHDAIKLELIEWLTKLDDEETIEYLKLVKDSALSEEDWWYNLTPEQKLGIEQGLRDIDEGRVTPHEEVKEKYGL